MIYQMTPLKTFSRLVPCGKKLCGGSSSRRDADAVYLIMLKLIQKRKALISCILVNNKAK